MSDSKPKAAKPTAAESEASTQAPFAPAAKPLKDRYHGQGGVYEIRNGERVLVQRTARKD